MRRDEADAQAREEEQDRRTQIVDSERRLRLLRGDQIDDLPAEDASPVAPGHKGDRDHKRKWRRLTGEDDTDRDMRLAKEGAIQQSRTSDTLRPTTEPLTDPQGHINLFPSRSQHKEKNVEAEAERAKKKREHEDQYTMRFSNAAGFKQGLDAPWYSTTHRIDADVPGKDVWGNDDIGRREREKVRANADDPLAAMKRGVTQLRDVAKSRKDWVAERERELQELKALEKPRGSRSSRRKRHRERDDCDGLEDFSLGTSSKGSEQEKSHHRRRSREHHSDSRRGRQNVVLEGERERSDIH